MGQDSAINGHREFFSIADIEIVHFAKAAIEPMMPAIRPGSDQ